MTVRGGLVRVAMGVLLGAAAYVFIETKPVLGGFSAMVTNSTSTAGSGALAFTHDYESSTCTSKGTQATAITCPGGINPTTATPASGSTSATDTITDNGSIAASSLTEQVQAASCAPVQLANAPDTANVMLARYGTTFAPSGGPMSGAGAITLDGANPGGYASAVVAQSQPDPVISLGATYGLGIWFKTTSTSGGPLFGIGTSAANASGGNDRILFMKPNGTLAFIQNTSGATTTTTASYNDGNWHFAYVTMSAVSVVLGVESTTTISVDGTTAATGGGLLVGYSADTGYWHVGWSPVSGIPAYFSGSLSNFVVFDTSGAPGAPTTAQRSSQSAFTAWASSATERWLLNDPGTTTFAGPYPVIGATSPCTMVDIEWGFTSPTSCAVAPPSTMAACTASVSLATFVADGRQTLAVPGPGGVQTSTITTSRAASYNAYVSGLHLYVPLSFRAGTSPDNAWSVTFTWSNATAAFVA